MVYSYVHLKLRKDIYLLSFSFSTEARQLLLLLATDEAAASHQKQTLISALRALDNALSSIEKVKFDIIDQGVS